MMTKFKLSLYTAVLWNMVASH